MKPENLLDAFGHLDEDLVAEAQNAPRRSNRTLLRRGAAVAACLLIALSAGLLIPKLGASDPAPLIQQAAPAADPTGMRKFMNYNGNRYVFMENGATYTLSSDLLTEELGTLSGDIQSDPERYARNDLAATFALGGKVYACSAYDPNFRVVVELDGNYYLCENVGTVDGSAMDLTQYFEWAGFADTATGAEVLDHVGNTVLDTLSQEDAVRMVELLSLCTPADLSNEDYERIARAQSEGQSYRVSLQLQDGTRFSFYVIPSLSIAMVGDNRYQVPDTFLSEFGDRLTALSQSTPPQS